MQARAGHAVQVLKLDQNMQVILSDSCMYLELADAKLAKVEQGMRGRAFLRALTYAESPTWE